MLNNDDIIDQYESYCKTQSTESTVKSYVRFAKKLTQYEASKNKDISDFTMADIQGLVKFCDPFGDNGFRNAKAQLKTYLKWLGEQGFSTEQQIEYLNNLKLSEVFDSDSLARCYFKNFKHLQMDLDAYISHVTILNETDNSEFDTIKAIFYLAWIGASIDQIREIKVSNIKIGKNVVVLPGGKETVAEDDIIDYLISYSKSQFCYRKSNTKDSNLTKFSYVPSVYLIRSSKSSQITKSSILTMATRLNKIDEEWPKKFLIRKIGLSGLFCRAYKKQIDIGFYPSLNLGTGNSLSEKDIEYFEYIFETTYTNWKKAKDLLLQFEKYKRYFYD